MSITPQSNRLSWRRGFFRFWVIGSALFVIAVAALSYSEIKAQFDAIAFKKVWEQDALVVPIQCGNARGIAGTDFTTKQGLRPGPWDLYAKPNPSDYCWYEMSKFRPLYPEFNNLSDKELSSKRYADLPPLPPGYELDMPPGTNPWIMPPPSGSAFRSSC